MSESPHISDMKLQVVKTDVNGFSHSSHNYSSNDMRYICTFVAESHVDVSKAAFTIPHSPQGRNT